jgi:hypothetical protein
VVQQLFAGKPPKQVVKRTASTYWDQVGKYQDLYNELFQQLVPSAGKCATVEGELLRAASKIYYDYYNNGFGNNWSGPWRFLETFAGKLDLYKELETLKPYAHGRMTQNRAVDSALDSLVDKVMEYLQSKNGEFSPNSSDMWDLQEREDVGEPEFLDDDKDYEATARKILTASYKFKLRKADDLSWGEKDKIEAYGVKGMKSTPWRKVFKNQKEFEKWLDKNEGNVEVQGTRKYLGAIGMPTDFSDRHPLETSKTERCSKEDLYKVVQLLNKNGFQAELDIRIDRGEEDVISMKSDKTKIPLEAFQLLIKNGYSPSAATYSKRKEGYKIKFLVWNMKPHPAEKRKAANWIYTIDLSRPWEVLDMLQEEDAPAESKIKAEFRNIADILDKVPDALRVPGRGLLNLHDDVADLVETLRGLAEGDSSSDELLEEGNRILQELYDWADLVKVWIKTTI